jgi:hypothetical protein
MCGLDVKVNEEQVPFHIIQSFSRSILSNRQGFGCDGKGENRGFGAERLLG